MRKLIKNWQTYNESFEEPLSQTEIDAITKTKLDNKDNNLIIFNIDKKGIVNNEVYFVEDSQDKKTCSGILSKLLFSSNFDNNIETAFSYVPKNLSNDLIPGKNIISDESLIRVSIERKNIS